MDKIVGDNQIKKYLIDYKNGQIKQGLGIGLPRFDEHLRFKDSQLNMVNGHDNVGKTVWLLWYFLCLAVKHNKKFAVWSGENKAEALVRQMIQFKVGRYFKNLDEKEIFEHQLWISEHFQFVDNKSIYKPTDLFKIFEKTGCHACLIDPYTGLDRDFSHIGNYQFLNESRAFCNGSGITTYVNTHPNTEAARSVHTKDSCQDDTSLIGYPKAPLKSQSEGGQPFANRVDDFLTIHRYVGHPIYGMSTHVYTRKIKDTDTGGMVMPINEPLEFDWNKGLGFTQDRKNPLNKIVKDDHAFEPMEVNKEFDNEVDEEINDLPF